MECVIDSSSLSWLEIVRYLDILPKIYTVIVAPPGVLTQLEKHYPVQEFIHDYVTPLRFSTKKEQRRFYRLARRWKKKVEIEDIVDAEVFVGHRFFTETNEALYANKEAKHKFGEYGNARDIADLYEPAEEEGIFRRNDSIKYLERLLDEDYNTKYVKELLKKLRL